MHVFIYICACICMIYEETSTYPGYVIAVNCTEINCIYISRQPPVVKSNRLLLKQIFLILMKGLEIISILLVSPGILKSANLTHNSHTKSSKKSKEFLNKLCFSLLFFLQEVTVYINLDDKMSRDAEVIFAGRDETCQSIMTHECWDMNG